MLSKEDNELICRVGPGTPMNALMKRYWIPGAKESDLPGPDGDPLRVKMLGETYVLFRDSEGRLGLLDEMCCHRGASLMLGRVEDGGIRCIYHGWKFGVDGKVLDMPIVSDARIQDRFRMGSYPVRVAGGLVWFYLGPPDKQPAFPDYPYMSLPEGNRIVVRTIMDCNWLQVMEGSFDSAHVGILHSRVVDDFNSGKDHLPSYMRKPQMLTTDNAPRIEVQRTDFGLHYAALRKLDDGRDGVGARISSYIFPIGAMVPPGGMSLAFVPLDDHTTLMTRVLWNRTEPVEREKALALMGLDQPGMWIDEHVDLTHENGFRQDRAAMRNGSFSGLPGFVGEDGAMQISMGKLMDRTREHLVPSDLAIVRIRRMLIDAARRMMQGEDPPCVEPSNTTGISSVDGYVPPDAPWQVLVPGHPVVEDSQKVATA